VLGGSNIGGYQSSLVDRLLTAAREATDEATALQPWRDLQAALAREMPIIPLAFADELYLVRDPVVGPVARPVPDAGGRYWDVLTWDFAPEPNR
jgi:ABC-type oligopeptide transport system substrate-binding subunit